MTKIISRHSEWGEVARDLEAEKLKLASYDGPLLDRLGNVTDKKILDYGCGPGVLALALKKLGADVRVFDISKDMLRLAGKKIGHEKVYETAKKIPGSGFDFVVCNLVLCINPDEEIRRIAGNIKNELKQGGRTYIGFCNPLIFDVPESKLDIRFFTGNKYGENHRYRKMKKEGWYEIVEDHRPIEWYLKIFKEAGLTYLNTIFTSEYEFNGRKINDFVILEFVKV